MTELRDTNMAKELMRRFTYHKPKGNQPERYEGIRAKALMLAMEVCGSCPESRERSLAVTKIEEAVFWANAAIARNEVEHNELSELSPASWTPHA